MRSSGPTSFARRSRDNVKRGNPLVGALGLMCGIGGFWAPVADAGAWDVAARLGAALRHRGPDDAGWLLGWTQACRSQAVHELAAARSEGLLPDLVLAHRRLSVVDLA